MTSGLRALSLVKSTGTAPLVGGAVDPVDVVAIAEGSFTDMLCSRFKWIVRVEKIDKESSVGALLPLEFARFYRLI